MDLLQGDGLAGVVVLDPDEQVRGRLGSGGGLFGEELFNDAQASGEGVAEGEEVNKCRGNHIWTIADLRRSGSLDLLRLQT